MGGTGQFASTTYYMQQHPGWVTAFNAASRRTASSRPSRSALPEAAYARSLPDSQPWFGPGGGKLPMMMGSDADDAPGPQLLRGAAAQPSLMR